MNIVIFHFLVKDYMKVSKKEQVLAAASVLSVSRCTASVFLLEKSVGTSANAMVATMTMIIKTNDCRRNSK